MKVIYDLDDELHRRAEQFFIAHFEQSGGYLPHVFTEYGQQGGEGFGSFLSGLFKRYIIPSLANGAKALGKQALNSVGDYVHDVASGANWQEAGQDRFREAAKNLGSKLGTKIIEQSGSGLRTPVYRNAYGMRTSYDQLGGGRNKTIHNAVKLFSFVPPVAERGRARARPVQRRRRRRRRTTTTATSTKTPARKRKRRTRTTTTTAASPTKRRKRTRKGRVTKRKTKTQAGRTRKRVTRKRRGVQQQQRGRGFDSVADWF
jgi:hypothetical protein